MATLTASLWNGQAVDPQLLIKAFGLKITPAPSGPAWRLVHIGYGHGIPKLRAEFSGTRPQTGCLFRSNGGTEFHLPVSGGVVSLDVNKDSYYSAPNEGPWSIIPDGVADSVRGVGMNIGIQPQPSAEEDNRYLVPLLFWAWDEGTSNPVTPPSDPTPITGGVWLTADQWQRIRNNQLSTDDILRDAMNRRPE